MMPKSQRLSYIFGIWIFISIAALTVFNSLDPMNLFLLSLIGFLIIFDLSGPFTVRPEWKSRVRVITIIGIAAFTVIAATKFIEIIGPRYI